MIKLFHCSCGARSAWATYCESCGKKRARYKPLLAALALIAIIATGFWLARARKPQPDQTADTLKSHRLAAARDPERDMDRVDTLLKTKGNGSQPTLEAIALLDDLIDAYPAFGYGQRLKANLLRNLHQDQAAIISYEAFLRQYPNDHRTRLALAEVLLRSEHPERGIALLEELVQVVPNYAEAHNRLAKAYDAQENSERAKTHLETAQTLVANKKNQKPPFLYLPRLPDQK